jgi:hypothetical protein
MSEGIPNTFQCFNMYVDRAMELLTDAELRCLLFATRHILGWKDRVSERAARLSLTAFENGFTDKNGKRYAGVGLSRPVIIKAVDSLVNFGFLERVGKPTPKGQRYELSDGDIDWSTLEARKAEKDNKNQKRIKKATAASLEARGVTSDLPVTSHGTGTSDVTGTGTSDVTGTGTSDVTESNPPSNPPTNPYIAPPAKGAAFTDLIKAWLDTTGIIDPNAYGKKAFRDVAKAMLDKGITPQDVSEHTQEKKRDPFWQDKPIPLTEVAKTILPWKEKQARPARYGAEPMPTDDYYTPTADELAHMEAVKAAALERMNNGRLTA